MLSDATTMADNSLKLLRPDEGWAGSREGASRDHYFRSDRRRSLCGGVIVLAAIGALTKIGGNKSCCRACNNLHSAELKRIAALGPAGPDELPGWEPRGGTQKRHFFGLAEGPHSIRKSLCRNAILLRSLHGLQPGYELHQARCSACLRIARRGVIFDPPRLPPGRA